MALIAALAAGGCEPDPAGDSRADRREATSVSSLADTVGSQQRDSTPSSAAIGDSVVATDENPFARFGLPGFDEPPVSMIRYPLRIENRSPAAMVVSATAGASTVVLDTIDPGEALRADLEAPSTGVVLGWSAIDGTGSGERTIEASSDSVQVVPIDGFPGSR